MDIKGIINLASQAASLLGTVIPMGNIGGLLTSAINLADQVVGQLDEAKAIANPADQAELDAALERLNEQRTAAVQAAGESLDRAAAAGGGDTSSGVDGDTGSG